MLGKDNLALRLTSREAKDEQARVAQCSCAAAMQTPLGEPFADFASDEDRMEDRLVCTTYRRLRFDVQKGVKMDPERDSPHVVLFGRHQKLGA